MMTTTASHTLPLTADGSPPRWSPARRATVATVGLTGAIAAAQFGGTDAGPELCIIRSCTGGWCPGCGGARAAHHLLHGELGAAWTDHPWVVLASAQLVLTIAVAAVAAVAVPGWGRRRRTAMAPRASPGRTALGAILLLNAGSLLAIWLVRIATGSIPSPWSP